MFALILSTHNMIGLVLKNSSPNDFLDLKDLLYDLF